MNFVGAQQIDEVMRDESKKTMVYQFIEEQGGIDSVQRKHRAQSVKQHAPQVEIKIFIIQTGSQVSLVAKEIFENFLIDNFDHFYHQNERFQIRIPASRRAPLLRLRRTGSSIQIILQIS